MSTLRIIPEIVTERQTTASNPAHSAWVSANAGSGKTHVLAQRVIRLLLNGVDPARILCITFTKAAAANMANKVFADLRDWIVLDDTKLDAAIRKTGVKTIDAALRVRARQLFALALETPGGLKVRTIHAFCTQLLHLFPFEANVPARFEVLDEITETQMLNTLSLEVLFEAARKPDTPLGRALAQAVLSAADQTFREMVRAAIGERDALKKWVEHAGGLDKALAQLSRELGVQPEETVADADAAMFGESLIPQSEWRAIADALALGSKTDQEQGARFSRLATLETVERLEMYLDIFCTAKRDKTRNSVATNAIKKADPALCDRLHEERDRVWALLQHKRAIETRDRSVALFTIAHAVIARFRAEKNRRGLLDYEDLIDKTLELLTEQSAAWVHYKLDSGIHHVLIDEAQDTSPKQWAIVKALVSDFFAGLGAHERKRTIFAVGDEKQSIFSFQGAAPREFAAMRTHFEQAHERASLKFVATEFKHSFRSGPNVLGAVDTVFARAEAFAGLSADAVAPVHESLPEAAPGLVEIWPLEQSDEIEKKPGWTAPFDIQSATNGAVKLARRIAATTAAWQRQGRQPKDILILVRRRGALFEAVIRALKQEKVPVAGADRLVLSEHIAVMDLMVLADSLLLPEDDLALATVLKSPLFGLDDATLEKLAWGRTGNLYAPLHAQQPALATQFDALRADARTLSPFAFYARLLGAGQGRRKFLARLGHEAADALDEFLNLALDYEARQTPSLQGFIAWLRAAEVQVKRDMEMDRNEVRVMTVHGAKGLEAPIVILADTTTRPEGWHPPRLLHIAPASAAPGTPARLAWATAKESDTPAMQTARAQALADSADEYRRLLYVAMTRAAERLIVCGGKGNTKIPDGCWYQLVSDALVDLSVSEPADDGNGDVLRYRKHEAARAQAAASGGGDAIETIAPPSWLSKNAPIPKTSIPTVTPSGIDEGAPRAIPGVGDGLALLRGSLAHRLMQSLPDIPAERRLKAAQDYLARAGDKLPAEERAKLAEQVMRVSGHPDFQELYEAGSRAEVPLVGKVKIGGGQVLVSGRIDRLAVTEKTVLIADFKTDRRPPKSIEDPDHPYVRQLALYRAVLTSLYPEKTIRAALIWTENVEFMEISQAMLDRALAQVTSARSRLDAAG
ncbi:MAG TPA: double-strand break repair helicase AddA [Pseudolabrys sp.]|nr:double-strand break repair helicase AddA [Pseudolabrys sp.]